MFHDGRKMTLCTKYGCRQADPERDVDSRGRPMAANYIVIVNISDCVVSTDPKTGRQTYNAQKAPQAFKLAMGGTYYGYHRVDRVARKARTFERFNKVSFIEKGDKYSHIRKLLVKDGYVYSTSYDHPVEEAT